MKFTGDNWQEMWAFTGSRNVESPDKPFYVPIFNVIGTYITPAFYPRATGELWVESEARHRAVYQGEWIVLTEETSTFNIVPDDGTGLAPLHHESLT